MNQTTSWFQNRSCILATMHKKERVMAPLLEQQLQMQVSVPEGFNTDIFGTFTRDIKRWGNQLETARFKAKKALNHTGASLAITSEGSFFPHPTAPYLVCDRELVLLVDEVNKIEIVGNEISLDTNFAHTTIETLEDALSFAQKVGFPSHGLVVMSNSQPSNSDKIFKGIVTEKDLVDAVNTIIDSSEKKAHLETDMRAMYNPTRMKVIAKATQNLINTILHHCPNCDCPGFDIVETLSGLCCALCNSPTNLIKSEIYQCQKCNFKQIKDFPKDIKFADPMYCNYCNP
jgi:hypothetical protein